MEGLEDKEVKGISEALDRPFLDRTEEIGRKKPVLKRTAGHWGDWVKVYANQGQKV